jgi:RND superfamily putative drug exporter
MQRLARFCIRNRWWVVGAWIAVIIGSGIVSSAAGGADYRNEFTLPGTETEAVANLLEDAGLTDRSGDSGTMVLHARAGTIADYQGAVLPVLQRACDNPDYLIASIASPWGELACTDSARAGAGDVGVDQAGDPSLVSADGSTGLVTISFTTMETTLEQIQGLADELSAARSDGLQVEFTGSGFAWLGFNTEGIPPMVFGFLAALVILALVFRTVAATALPLLTALAALMTGMSLLALLTHVMSVADFAPALLDLMVIGVGVDYALFMVTRHRRNLLGGMGMADSIALAVNTSGRAVLFAGGTVCIALLGLCALGVSFLYGVAVGTAIGVGLTVIASVTLLPALLSIFGHGVLPRRQRKAVKAGTYVHERERGFWFSWARLVQARAAVLSVIAGAFIVVLAIPFLSIRLGSADQGNDPAATTTRKGYDLISEAFGQGYNSALQLVVSGPDASDQAFLDDAVAALREQDAVAEASIATVPISDDVTMITFKTDTSPQDEATTDLVEHLRGEVIPDLLASSGTPAGSEVYVYGITAVFIDFADVLTSKMPFFFIAVIGLSFLLLMIAFRSVVIPATAAAMNLVAAGAAFGVIVAIFQWGWGAELLGIGKGGPVEPFIPVMLFAILFGLSMDYQVFLVSRMHEEWTHTRDNRRSVTVGQGETGGIITAAAMIMIAVFGGFVLGDERAIKLLGLGLAVGVFLDAFVLRTVLVPALMHRVGDANWWFPRWLEWLPKVQIEAADEAPDTADGNAAGPRREDPERALV